MVKLCECGCGNPAPIAKCGSTKFGYVRGQPVRFIRGHATRRNIPDYIPDEDGCWIWNRGIANNGYGQTGEGATAHRRMYERLVGPIPKGMEIDHICRNRACVNPAHLEVVSRSENMLRTMPYSRVHMKAYGRKLTDEQVMEVRSSKESNRRLGKKYGVSHETIRCVRCGVNYKEGVIANGDSL